MSNMMTTFHYTCKGLICLMAAVEANNFYEDIVKTYSDKRISTIQKVGKIFFNTCCMIGWILIGFTAGACILRRQPGKDLEIDHFPYFMLTREPSSPPPPAELVEPADRNYICPITQKPIRHVLVLHTDSPEAPRLYFEKSAIKSWINDRPHEAPPHWPQDFAPLPIRHYYFENCRRVQEEIDKRFELEEEVQREG